MFSVYVASTACPRDPSSRVLLWVPSFSKKDFPDLDTHHMIGTTKLYFDKGSDILQELKCRRDKRE